MPVVQTSWRRRHDPYMQGEITNTNLVQTTSHKVVGADTSIAWGHACQLNADNDIVQSLYPGSIFAGLAPMNNELPPDRDNWMQFNHAYTDGDTMSAVWFGEMAVRVLHTVMVGQNVYVEAPTGQLTGSRQDGVDWVGSVSISAGGSGYDSTGTVTFSAAPSGGRTATGTLIVSSGAVVGVAITDPGAGYTAAPTLTFSTGGATGTAVLGPRVRIVDARFTSAASASGLATVRLGGSLEITTAT